MAVDFHFRSVEDKKDLEKLIKWIRPQGLNYPNWYSWVNKSFFEILSGYKKAIIVESNNLVLGSIIYQTHKENKWLLEIKNARISPRFWNKYCGSFLFKQVEVETKGKYGAIICDLKSNQKGVFNFLLRQGYIPFGERALYDNHNPDIIMVKPLNKGNKSGAIYNAKELIFGK